MKKAIITGNAHPSLVTQLSEKGYNVTYNPHITYNEIKTQGQDATGLVLTTRVKVDKELIDALPKLQWIGRLGSGMELVDVPYAESKGIFCTSSPEGNRNAVAEHLLGLLLMHLNKMNIAIPQVQQGIWLREKNRGTELSGKTVGIIGYGNTGSTFSQLLRPFGVTVLAYDKYKNNFAEGYVKEASLEQVCKWADIIAFCVPLTVETHHLLNDELLHKMQQNPLILSACRGKVICTEALIRGIHTQAISGACLDVLENEKLHTHTEAEKQQFYELLSLPNVIVTPHIAGYTHEAFLKMTTVLLEKLHHKL